MREVNYRLLVRELAVSRRAIPSCEWSRIADKIVADRALWEKHLLKPNEQMNRDLMGGLTALQNDGVVIHPLRLETAKVVAIRNHLAGLPVIRGSHIFSSDFRQRPFAEVQRDSAFAGYTVDQLLRTPHLVDFFNQPAIVDFLQVVLGCVPTLYSINAWWSLPAVIPTGHGMQLFHRDTDDWRFITLFVYLTDVGEEAGPHQLIAGSHTLAGTQRLFEAAQARGAALSMSALDSFSDENFFGSTFSQYCERYFQDSIVNIAGPEGTVFMANTLAIHRGLMPTKVPRLIAWARYGLGPNTNSVDREQGPLARAQVDAELPDTLRNRYVNRLLFEFDRGYNIGTEIPDWIDRPQPTIGVQLREPDAIRDTSTVTVAMPITTSPAMRSAAAAKRVGARHNMFKAILPGFVRRLLEI